MTRRHTILVVLTLTMTLLSGALALSAQSGYDLFQKALAAEHADGNLRQAILLYERVVNEFAGDRALAARALMRMGECYEKLGSPDAQKVYERITRDFADQADAAAQARAALASSRLAADTPSRPAARQIWAGITTLYPTLPSEDGRFLSFTDWDTGDLAIRDLKENTTQRLTIKGGWTTEDYADASVVSRDGRQVAYAWFDSKTRTYDLRIVSLVARPTASPTVIHRSTETSYIAPAAWMPDGGRLVVVRTLLDQTNQIAIVSVPDGSLRVLKSLQWRWPFRVSLSPDGRRIAYDVPAADDEAARDIFVLNADGSGETAVVQHPGNDLSPLWSLDGRRLIFVSDRTGSAALWTVNVDASRAIGAPLLLKSDLGRFTPLGITRGGALYYVAGGSRQNIYVAALNDEPTGPAPPALVTERHLNANSVPAWSPDGRRLAYLSQRWMGDGPGAMALVVRSADTGEERDVPLRVNLLPPVVRWFPDSRSVLVAARDAQRPRFAYYRVDVERGTSNLVHYTKSRVRNGNMPDVSPDGRSIVYVDSEPGSGAEQLMRFDLETGRETLLGGPSGAQIGSLALSPDGAWIAFLATTPPVSGSTALHVMPAGGGEPRAIYQPATWGVARFHGLAWTPDSRYLLFVRPPAPEPPAASQPAALWRIPVAGGEPERIAAGLGAPRHPDVHPDGRRLAFDVEEAGTTEVWALENFLAAPARTR